MPAKKLPHPVKTPVKYKKVLVTMANYGKPQAITKVIDNVSYADWTQNQPNICLFQVIGEKEELSVPATHVMRVVKVK